MEKDIVLEVGRRTETGKNRSRRMRREGEIPGIVYGLDRPPFPVKVNARKVDDILKLGTGKNTLFTLELAGEAKTRAVMFRELQRDPVTEKLLHVDFIRVDLETKVTVSVPVHPVGTPAGVKTEGGLLDFIHRQVQVECLPGNIPDSLEVDVSGLHVNQHVSAADVKIGDQIRIVDDPAMIIATVAPPRTEVAPVEEEEETAGEEAAEPEVAKKGKEAATEEEGASDKSA